MFINPIVDKDHVGSLVYSIDTPDGTVSGVMTIAYVDGEYSGTITAYDQGFPMTDIECIGNEFSFSTEAGGYRSAITGVFDGDTYTAEISVEGMQLPLEAKRAES